MPSLLQVNKQLRKICQLIFYRKRIFEVAIDANDVTSSALFSWPEAIGEDCVAMVNGMLDIEKHRTQVRIRITTNVNQNVMYGDQLYDMAWCIFETGISPEVITVIFGEGFRHDGAMESDFEMARQRAKYFEHTFQDVVQDKGQAELLHMQHIVQKELKARLEDDNIQADRNRREEKWHMANPCIVCRAHTFCIHRKVGDSTGSDCTSARDHAPSIHPWLGDAI